MSDVVNSLPLPSYEETGKGRPLVLIAGLGATRLFWWKQVKPLSQRFRVVAVDNRDAGDSPQAQGPYSVSDMADDTARLITSLGLGSAHIVGISMGGFITLDLALRYPELVARTVLVSTSAGGPAHIQAGPELYEAMIRIDGEDVETRMRRILPFITGPRFAHDHPEDVDGYIEAFLAKPMADEPYERQMAAITEYARYGTAPRLAEITAPTLVVHGTEDRVIPFANGEYLASHIINARFSAYPDTGHLPPLEAPDRFNWEVAGFLG